MRAIRVSAAQTLLYPSGKIEITYYKRGKTEPCDYCDYNSFELQNRSNVYFNYGASLDLTIVRETAPSATSLKLRVTLDQVVRFGYANLTSADSTSP